MGCAHKTIADHSVLLGERRLWTCSNCRAASTWAESWGYFGNMECRRCQTAQIDFVYCSDACKTALAVTRGLETERPSSWPARRPSGRADRAGRCGHCHGRGHYRPSCPLLADEQARRVTEERAAILASSPFKLRDLVSVRDGDRFLVGYIQDIGVLWVEVIAVPVITERLLERAVAPRRVPPETVTLLVSARGVL